jgi:hypothetical protein
MGNVCTLSDDANTPTIGALAWALYEPYAVRAWLEAKCPYEVVGTANNANACTLHQYVADTTGRQVSVKSTNYQVGDSWTELYPMPAWAQHFVIYHDTLNGLGPRQMTAAEALRALALALGETLPETEWEAKVAGYAALME